MVTVVSISSGLSISRSLSVVVTMVSVGVAVVAMVSNSISAHVQVHVDKASDQLRRLCLAKQLCEGSDQLDQVTQLLSLALLAHLLPNVQGRGLHLPQLLLVHLPVLLLLQLGLKLLVVHRLHGGDRSGPLHHHSSSHCNALLRLLSMA